MNVDAAVSQPCSLHRGRRHGVRTLRSHGLALATEESSMDALYIGLTMILFAAALGLLRLCDRV
jgi:hypothetical protein